MSAIVWFRQDLRLSDNAAVSAAVADHGARVTGVVVLPPDGSREVLPGGAQIGAHRMQWWLQSVESLRRAFLAVGGTLLVAVGDGPTCVAQAACELNAAAVYTAPWPATWEQAENERLSLLLAGDGVRLRVLRETTLLDVRDLPFPVQRLPDVFTTFRRAVEREWRVRDPLPAPASLTSTDVPDSLRSWLNTPGLDALGYATPTRDQRSSIPWEGGIETGRARIQQYFWQTDGIASYKETRNGLAGESFSSKFSPWLSAGSLSAREVYAALRTYENERVANESTYWLVFELLWRDYFHFWTEQHERRVFHATGVTGRTPRGGRDAAAFRRWREGRTNEPFVDAGMRELAATGFLSNRLRQNVASWFAKTAGLDWRWGAAWFESQLIDFDVCSNQGNWQYVAGVGNDPRDRTFNVRSQADRYDADGAYRSMWLR
jgi:deoxyribodipyrimidine photo-lyase